MQNSTNYPFISTCPKHSEKIDASNGRCQVGRDSLNVEIELSSLHALNDRDPQYTDDHHDAHEYAVQSHTQGVSETIRMTYIVQGGTELLNTFRSSSSRACTITL